jgi:hypothetical protein
MVRLYVVNGSLVKFYDQGDFSVAVRSAVSNALETRNLEKNAGRIKNLEKVGRYGVDRHS